MQLDDIPLFAALKSRMSYLDQRQKLVAQNVANADVAGFTPRDLKPQDFSALMGAARTSGAMIGLNTTLPGHFGSSAGTSLLDSGGPGAGAGGFQTVEAPDSETRMNGNSVVLEEEMLKMAESRMAYDAAVSFYQQSLNMLRMAARKPGG